MSVGAEILVGGRRLARTLMVAGAGTGLILLASLYLAFFGRGHAASACHARLFTMSLRNHLEGNQ